LVAALLAAQPQVVARHPEAASEGQLHAEVNLPRLPQAVRRR
jgi:hypothetical protein